MTRGTKRTPLYSQIRDYVLGNIQQRNWRENDQLPTEMELAEKYNVSRFTVKKALSELVDEGLIYRIQGKGSFVAAVSDELQERAPVPDAAVSAQNQIVFLTPHVGSSLSSNILAGAEQVLSQHGCQLVIKTSRNEQETERQVLLDSVRAGVRGVLIFPVDGESYNEDLLRLTLNKFPVVVIDRYLRGVDTNCVCSDNAGGAYEATSHLINLGHRRIAYISGHARQTTSLEERLAGYEKALADHQLPIGPRFNHFFAEEHKPLNGTDDNHPDSQLDRMSANIRKFLAQNPDVTAVFAAGIHSGIAAMKAAEHLGLQVPEQLSVLFFDDYEFSSFSRIPPTCIVQQEEQLGIEAAKLLLSVINNPLQERRKITLPTRLLLRSSTAPPPAANEPAAADVD